jgi:hypothetical protein
VLQEEQVDEAQNDCKEGHHNEPPPHLDEVSEKSLCRVGFLIVGLGLVDTVVNGSRLFIGSRA